MNYATVWRIFIAVTIPLALSIPAFQYWDMHPFLILYWSELVLGLLAADLLVLVALPLFDDGLPIWARIACVVLSLGFPVFLPYWIIRIELPIWRARRMGK